MAQSLFDFIQYFRDLAGAHVELQDFVHGAASRIIFGSRSSHQFPLLWLETPTLSLADKDGTAPFGTRSAAFVVLHSVANDDYAAQDMAWAQTEAIALDVLSWLRKAHKARQIVLSSLDSTHLEAVGSISAAGELGWRYEFSLGDYVPLKFDPTRWKP